MSVQKDTPTIPSMAVLINGSAFSNLRQQVVNPRIGLLIKANQKVNLNLYFFSMSGVRLWERLINGLYWDEEKNIWLSKEFGFPDVLYLRGGTNHSPRFNMFLDILRSRNAKIINYPRFDKWRLFQVINNDQVLKSYLPVTTTVKELQDIEKMLHEFKIVYLKPHNGRKGKNVLRVEKLFDGRYLCSYFKDGQLNNSYKNNGEESVINTVFDFQSLLEIIYEFFNGKQFLIQQAIELIKSENRLVDMRAELQRNGNGSLEITGISVRLGRMDSPITTHGEAYRFDHFFKDILHYSKERVDEIQDKVNEFLFRIYECIENTYGEYVEIGLDFAVDINDKIWFIEANSQSTKISLGKAYGQEVLFKAYKNILEYAIYVSNQQIES